MKFSIIIAEETADVQDEVLRRLMSSDKRIDDLFVNPDHIIGITEYKIDDFETKAVLVMSSREWLHVEESFKEVSKRVGNYWKRCGVSFSEFQTTIDTFDYDTGDIIESEEKGAFWVLDRSIEYIRKEFGSKMVVSLTNKDEIVVDYISTSSLHWFEEG